jgi:hypothetical protein
MNSRPPVPPPNAAPTTMTFLTTAGGDVREKSPSRRLRLIEFFPQIDHTIFPKRGDRTTGLGVELNELVPEGYVDEAFITTTV